MPTRSYELNCSTFGNACVDSMGWPEEFNSCPLLRSALAMAAACADKALSIALNDVVGRIDMISSEHWPGRRELLELFQTTVEQVYRRHADQGDGPNVGTRVKKPATSKAGHGKSRSKRRKVA